MVRLPHLLLVLGMALLLPACQTGLPGTGAGSDPGVTPDAVLGDPIEVTALDEGPPGAAVAEASQPAPAGPPTATAAQSSPQSSPPPAAPPAAAGATPAPLPTGGAASADDPAAQPAPAAEPAAESRAVAAPKSEAQIACERRRGLWRRTGVGELRICQFTTRDGGERCTRQSDCEGLCLARSGTCAPIRPLLGCHEILQDNGARVTQCVQ